MASTNDVLSTSLDGTLAFDAPSSSTPLPPSETTSLHLGTRLRTWPVYPLTWLSLCRPHDPTTDVAKRALVNSIAGTTLSVSYMTGEELGRKPIGKKETGPGTKNDRAEPRSSHYTFLKVTHLIRIVCQLGPWRSVLIGRRMPPLVLLVQETAVISV